MFLGTLKEVMNLNEDGVAARRAKAMNNARKDPNTRIAIQFDGTPKNKIEELKKIATPSQLKMLNSENPKNPDTPNPYNLASYNYKYNVYTVNKNAPNSDAIHNGKINWNSHTMNHETQHDIQNQVIQKVAQQNKISSFQTNKKQNEYNSSISQNDDRNYRKNPLEFEAEIAGTKKNPHASMGTYRLAHQVLGVPMPKKEFIPSLTHSAVVQNKSLGLPVPIDKRKALSAKMDNSPDDRQPVPADNTRSMKKFNQNGQRVINNIKIPTRAFEPQKMDEIKGMSSDPNVNKSKNIFVKVHNKQGKMITVPQQSLKQ